MAAVEVLVPPPLLPLPSLTPNASASTILTASDTFIVIISAIATTTTITIIGGTIILSGSNDSSEGICRYIGGKACSGGGLQWRDRHSITICTGDGGGIGACVVNGSIYGYLGDGNNGDNSCSDGVGNINVVFAFVSFRCIFSIRKVGLIYGY